MEHDRKINLFYSELYLPLGHTGWRHHRIAQRRKGPLLLPARGCIWPRTDCSPEQPDEIKPQPQPSLSLSLHHGPPLISLAHFYILRRKVSIQINFCLSTVKILGYCTLKSERFVFFFPKQFCVKPVSLPTSSQVEFWVV